MPAVLATGNGGCTAGPGMLPKLWPGKQRSKHWLSAQFCLSRRDGTSCRGALHARTCLCFHTSTPVFSSSWGSSS